MNRNPRRRRAKNHNNNRNGILALVAVLTFGALALAPAILAHRDATRAGTAMAMTGSTLVPAPTQAPTAQPTAAPTQAPTAAPTQAPTAQPTEAPTVAPAAPEPFEFLPVVYKANTEQKRIAITVDDCYQTENLREIVGLAESNGAKLTLFPVGENIGRTGMADILKRCVFDLGFEIENHTWSHARVFRLPEDEMAAEIWKQSRALNLALGVDYRQHLFRLMGGDGATDERVHNYLKQLGYMGIAEWSLSGSDAKLQTIENSLAPGMVYLFHTTDADTKKLREFIPWVRAQGYEMVTMNALFGVSENTWSELTDADMPAPRPFDYDYRTQKKGDYTWIVARMQDALRAGGYLHIEGESTGYYGDQTAEAVAAFQRDHDIDPTGEADERTQREILES